MKKMKIVPFSGYGIVRVDKYIGEENIQKLKTKVDKYPYFRLRKGDINGWCLYVGLNSPDSNAEYGEEEIDNAFFSEIEELLIEEHEYIDPWDIEKEVFNDYCIRYKNIRGEYIND